jgi:hypothetical protein
MQGRAFFQCVLALCLAWTALGHAQAPVDARQKNVELIKEKQALHIGTLAYLWGFPIVDLSRQMHNETHRVAPAQAVLAPVNQFFYNQNLITPETAGELRAPNSDTLYLSGWFDLSKEPVVVQVPDTAGRYYTLAVTDFFNEVTHLGRRTTGTHAQAFALVGPKWQGTLPAGVKPVNMATQKVWILGRLAVTGEPDLPAARALLQKFNSAPLSVWQAGPAVQGGPSKPQPVPAEAAKAEPLGRLVYFEWLNRWLQDNAPRPGEEALVRMFDQIGLGPNSKFKADALDASTRRGLEAAIAEAQALLRASSQQPLPDVRNGWIFPLGLADYGENYLMRASVAAGGYANRPEETVYAARTVDERGQLMTGNNRYRIRFAPGTLPPVGAFWSISAYDLRTFSLIPNSARRFAIGDRTPGLLREPDGSLVIDVSSQPPPRGSANWLPVSDAPFSLIVRMYEPDRAILDGRYRLPPLELTN